CIRTNWISDVDRTECKECDPYCRVAKMKRDAGEDTLPAAIDGAKLRFRPILMTSFAFILGVVPLLTASGAGAEGRKVMGMAVFAGMLTATIIGVLLIPAFFVLIE